MAWETLGNQSSAAHSSLRNSSARAISFHNFPGTILLVLLIFKQTRKPTKWIFRESPKINPLHPRLSTGLLGFAQMCHTMQHPGFQYPPAQERGFSQPTPGSSSFPAPTSRKLPTREGTSAGTGPDQTLGR